MTKLPKPDSSQDHLVVANHDNKNIAHPPDTVFEEITEDECFEIKEIKRHIRSQLETQMTLCHQYALEFLGKASGTFSVETEQSHIKLSIKLQELFIKQLTAMNKITGNSSSQNINVKHINLNQPGGQMVVGNVGTQGNPEGKGE